MLCPRLSVLCPRLSAPLGACARLSAPLGALSAPLGALSAPLGALSAPLAACPRFVRASRHFVRGSLCLSARLGALSARLGTLSARLGTLFARLGTLSAHLGTLSARLGTLSARLGASSAALCACPRRFVPFRAPSLHRPPSPNPANASRALVAGPPITRGSPVRRSPVGLSDSASHGSGSFFLLSLSRATSPGQGRAAEPPCLSRTSCNAHGTRDLPLSLAQAGRFVQQVQRSGHTIGRAFWHRQFRQHVAHVFFFVLRACVASRLARVRIATASRLAHGAE